MDFSISSDRKTLTLTVTDEERAELRELPENCDNGERVSIHSDDAMADFLEPITCNSELDWINAVDTGDLTDAPMLGICDYGAPMTSAPGSGLRVLERWAWMGYETRSFLEVLRDNGEIHLTGGPLE